MYANSQLLPLSEVLADLLFKITYVQLEVEVELRKLKYKGRY